MNQVALSLEKAVDVIDEIARDLLDPCRHAVADHAGDVDAARFEVDCRSSDPRRLIWIPSARTRNNGARGSNLDVLAVGTSSVCVE